MATKLKLIKLLRDLDTNLQEVQSLMMGWETETIPIYDKITAAIDKRETNVILLALAASIGKFAEDMEPDNSDSVIDMIATIAKARLYLLKENREKQQ